MPESVNNVTTGTGLLHEVFHETVKQSFVSLGFPVYEYDQTSGQFKDVANGQPLGFEVRFANIRELFTTDYNYNDWAVALASEINGDDNLVLSFEATPKSSGGHIVHANFLGSQGNVVGVSRNSSGPFSSSHYYEPRSVFYDIPTQGRVLVISFGRSSTSGSSSSPVTVSSYSYDPSNYSLTHVQSVLPIPAVSAVTHSYPVSKVFVRDLSDTQREYYVFFFHHREDTAITSLRLLRVLFNKSNGSISNSWIEVIPNVNNVSSSDLIPQSLASSWGVGPYLYAREQVTQLYHAPQIQLKLPKQEIESLSFSGNLIIPTSRGVRPWNRNKFLIIKVPFSAQLDSNNLNNSSFSFDRNAIRVYGPIDLGDIYLDGYIASDASRIEFRRRSSYTPPSQVLGKVKNLKNPWFTNAFVTVNNDIDEERISISIFQYNRHRDWHWFNTSPFAVISSFEITPGGGVYYLGSTFLDQVTFIGGFTLNNKVMFIGQVWASDIYSQSTSSGRVRLLAVSFSSLPEGVQWGSGLDKRKTQPYIVKISHPDFISYRVRKDLTNQDRTVFTRENEFYMTSVIWTGMYQSGFFLPYFHVAKRGGDGVWFDPDVLYLGVPSYDSNVRNPSYCFGVNGSPLFFYRDENDSSNHYIIGDQINSTISLVFKSVLSPDRSAHSLVAIQGSNDLKFIRYFVYKFDRSLLTMLAPFVLPFGNVLFGNNYFYEHYQLFPLTSLPVYYGARLKGKVYNVRLFKDDLRKAKIFHSYDYTQNEIRADSINNFTFSGNLSYPIPLMLRSWGNDFHTAWGITLQPVYALSDPTSAVFAVDSSQTLRVGDYVQVTDDEGNVYQYTVVNTASDTFYNSFENNNTSTYRALLMIRKD